MASGLASDCDLDDLRSRGAEAVSDLFRCHRDRLLRMITFRLDPRLLNKVGGEDVLQDVFVEAIRRIAGYLDQPTVPVFVWLRQIAGQILIDTHRRYLGARMRDVDREVRLHWGTSADASSTFLAEQLAGSFTTPSQCLVRAETIAAVRTSLEELAPIDREVLVLRHLEGLSNHEAAQVLGIDKFAASKRYLRALARLGSIMPRED